LRWQAETIIVSGFLREPGETLAAFSLSRTVPRHCSDGTVAPPPLLPSLVIAGSSPPITLQTTPTDRPHVQPPIGEGQGAAAYQHQIIFLVGITKYF